VAAAAATTIGVFDSAVAAGESRSHRKAKIEKKLQCGPMPNVMAALSNTGGALCSTPQSLADAQYWSAVQ